MNDELVLTPSPVRWILIGLVMLGLAAMFGISALTNAADVGTQVLLAGLAALALAGAGFAGKALIPGAAWLRLSPQGFAVKPLRGATRSYRWDDVSAFDTATVRTASFVCFTVTTDSNHGVAQSLQQAVIGSSHNLPDTYGGSPTDLAALMNDWRARAATRRA